MPHTPAQTRQEYIDDFAPMMVTIWREKLSKLKAMRTCNLFSSVSTLETKSDAEVSRVLMRFSFRQYGHYVQRGVGREVPRGNGGDIGRAKVRRRKEWYQPKYAGSVHRLREFFAKSFSLEAIGIINTTLTKKA